MRSSVAIMGALAALLAACSTAQPAGSAPAGAAPEAALAPKKIDYGPIPGPRDCFWLRGPHSADPYINIAYPDANVFYWAAVFSIPEGAKLSIEGDFPHSRYMSLISYDAKGVPVESVADYLIRPADANGVNPYIPGARRDSVQRRYSVSVVNVAPDSERPVGERSAPGSVETLHAPAYGAGQQVVLYRIYLPDAATGATGGASLPTPVLTLADGSQKRGEAACGDLRTRQPLGISPDAVGVPTDEYRKLVLAPERPETWPAFNPAGWFIQLDRPSLLGMYTGKINEDARRSEGGFYPNLDNNYIRTIVNRKHGTVFMVRGKAPTTPHTYGGEKITGDGQLRYWSICSNQGFANTRVNDCLFDEELPLDAQGFYTVMVSRPEDRPRNATPECGIGWLPMAKDGDGTVDDDVTIVQIRHMLTAPDFPNSVQRVLKQADLTSTMGPYMPQTRYMLPNQAESFFPCLPKQ